MAANLSAVDAHPATSSPSVAWYERWLPWILAAIAASPSLILRFPMGPDLPMHTYGAGMAVRGVLGTVPPGLLEFRFGSPNQLFTLLVVAVGLVAPIVWAIKLVVSANAMVYMLGAGRLARHMGKSPWALCLVLPVCLGFSYYLGMQAYQLACGMLFAAVVEAERLAVEATWKNLAKVVAWEVVLYETHEQAFVFYAGCTLLFALGQTRTLRAWVIKSIPFALGVLTGLVHIWAQDDRLKQTAIMDQKPIFLSLKSRLFYLPGTLYGSQMLYTAVGLLAVSVLALGALGFCRWREGGLRWPGFRAGLWESRIALLALVSLTLFLAGPNSILTANYVAERFLPWAMVLGTLVLAPSAAGLPRLLKAPLMMVPIGYLVVMLPSLREVESSVRHLEALLPYIEPGSAVAQVNADIAEPDPPFTTFQGDAWVATQLGGRPLHSFAYSTVCVACYTTKSQWRDATKRLIEPNTLAWRPKLDMTAFRYILIHSQSVTKNQVVARLFMPEARFVASTGNWTLLESTLKVRPLSTPFGTPGFCGDTLADRLMAVVDLLSERDWLESGTEVGQCTAEGGRAGLSTEQIRRYMQEAYEKSTGRKLLMATVASSTASGAPP